MFFAYFLYEFPKLYWQAPQNRGYAFRKRKPFSEVPLILKHWQTHAEYQQFISDAVSHLNDSQRKKTGSYSYSIAKLSDLNLDPARDFMLPFYSSTGRSALNLPQVSAWLTGATALHAMTWNGTVQPPLERKKSVPAKSPALPPHTGAVYILNLIGISAFTHRLPVALMNIKRLIITTRVQNVWLLASTFILMPGW